MSPRICPCCMSKDTPFKAMTPPNTTLTSRTASKGERRCASCACIISFRPNDRPGRNDHAKLFAGYNDEGYLLPLTTRLNFPPAFNFVFVFLIGAPSCLAPAPGNHLHLKCRTEPRNLRFNTTGSESKKRPSPMSPTNCCQLPARSGLLSESAAAVARTEALVNSIVLLRRICKERNHTQPQQ